MDLICRCVASYLADNSLVCRRQT